MERNLAHRRKLSVDDESINKKKKSSHDIERNSITRLEKLPNELFFEIFDYLDIWHVHRAFSNLNTRLQNLLFNSNIPLNVDISSISQSNFQNYDKNTIILNKHRIKSLRLANPFIVDIILSPVSMVSKLTGLQTLIFDHITSKYLRNILKYLLMLPNLSNLVLIPIDRTTNIVEMYKSIFRLPALKYCKVVLKTDLDYDHLPISTDLTSPIQHFIINHGLSMNNLNALLSYVPQLCRLTLNHLTEYLNNHTEVFSSSIINLKHVSINVRSVPFEKFQLIAKSAFKQLEFLSLEVDTNRTYLEAKQWEQLIISSIPNLKTFDFRYDNTLYNMKDDDCSIYMSLFDQFYSSFWSKRNWLFGYEFYTRKYSNGVKFYSINPYRGKQYTIYKPLPNCVTPHFPTVNVDAVKHVEIHDQESILKCLDYFQNATKLTLSFRASEDDLWFQICLDSIISLQRLTTLVIDSYSLGFERLVLLLTLTPNLHTLTIDSDSFISSDSASFQQNAAFQFVSNTNKITNVFIKDALTEDSAKVLIVLCPRMQRLTINTYIFSGNALTSTLRFILMETRNQQLCLIHINRIRNSINKKLKTLIKSEKLLDRYSTKFINFNFYLWW